MILNERSALNKDSVREAVNDYPAFTASLCVIVP